MFIADLHLHSHYSRATSKHLTIDGLYQWAQYKGIDVIGTGDFTHPLWFAEMQEKLEPIGDTGLFKLKDEYAAPIDTEMFTTTKREVRFMLTSEISTIYKKNDRVRKVHSVIWSPSFEAVARIIERLLKLGANLKSDGRPIIGMHTKDLLAISLETDEHNLFVPAHIWTPHFAVFGSNSGYDSLEECFEDLTPHIYAVETGLSSDPAMNYRLSCLDNIALVSNSDAHSPSKLAREANIFNCEKTFYAIHEAITKNDYEKFYGTIEFYPEEGKYHLDGHRNCKTRLYPEDTERYNGTCPVCEKPVTVGVMHRVHKLADRKRGEGPARQRPFESIIPLVEIVAEVYRQGVSSKKVQMEYFNLLQKLGPELEILRTIPIEQIKYASMHHRIAEAIKRVREGNVVLNGGYDGEYGTIRIFDEAELNTQQALF